MTEVYFYQDVLDTSLGQTLREHGFIEKSEGDYILEEPQRTLIFEFETFPEEPQNFKAKAAIRFHDFNAITGTESALTTTRRSAHIEASLPQLMGIAAGHDFYTSVIGLGSEAHTEARHHARSDPIMRYQRYEFWTVPKYASVGDENSEVNARRYRTAVSETSHFLSRQWRDHIWKWYRRCKDPYFVVDWFRREHGHEIDFPIWLTILYHIAGDAEKASACLRNLHAEAVSRSDAYSRHLSTNSRPELTDSLASMLGAQIDIDADEVARENLESLELLFPVIEALADRLGIELD